MKVNELIRWVADEKRKADAQGKVIDCVVLPMQDEYIFLEDMESVPNEIRSKVL